jgi:hypothetical protein
MIGVYLDIKGGGMVILSLRGAKRRSNLGGEAMRVPSPGKSGLATTKSDVPGEAGHYKNLEVKCEDT